MKLLTAYLPPNAPTTVLPCRHPLLESLRTGRIEEEKLRAAAIEVIKREIPPKIRDFRALLRLYTGRLMKTEFRISDMKMMQDILEDEIKNLVIMEPFPSGFWFKLSLREVDEGPDELNEDENVDKVDEKVEKVDEIVQ